MNMEEAQRFLRLGTNAINRLIMGPPLWETFPSVEIQPDMIFEYQIASLNAPAAVQQSYIEGQRALAHRLIDQCADGMTQWAKDNNRPDLLATVGERLEKAVLASDET